MVLFLFRASCLVLSVLLVRFLSAEKPHQHDRQVCDSERKKVDFLLAPDFQLLTLCAFGDQDM